MSSEDILVLGDRADGDPAVLDLERLIGTHLAVVANSGAGKTWLVRKLLELTHGVVQQIVIDPEEDFYTLRELEGSSYVLIGGETGDVPLTIAGAGQLALAILEHGFSAILQVGQFPDVEDQQAFVGAFTEALVNAPRRLWHPALIVVDEAQLYAPEGEKPESLRGMRMLTTQGRKRGFTAVLATLNMAQIANSVVRPVNNWLLGRAGLLTDRAQIAKNLGFPPSSPEAQGIKSLEDGEFWGYGPALAKEPIKLRIGPVRTTHLKSGQTKVPTPPAPEALREILAAFAAETSAEPSSAPEAAAATGGTERKAEFDRGYQLGLSEGERREWARTQRLWTERTDAALARLAEELKAEQQARVADPVEAPPLPKRRPGRPGSPTPAAAAPPTDAPPSAAIAAPAKAPRDPDLPLSKGAAELIDSARFAPRQVTWDEAAILAGRMPVGGYFERARKELRDAGWAEPPPNDLSGEDGGPVWVELIAAHAERFAKHGVGARLFRHIAFGGKRDRATAAAELGVAAHGGHWERGWKAVRTSPLTIETDAGVDLVPILRELRRSQP